MGRQKTTQKLGISVCHGYGGNQGFRLSTTGRIQFDEYCLAPNKDQTQVVMTRCRESHRKVVDPDFWSFSEVGLLSKYTQTFDLQTNHLSLLINQSNIQVI